jgi:hypothetical protein
VLHCFDTATTIINTIPHEQLTHLELFECNSLSKENLNRLSSLSKLEYLLIQCRSGVIDLDLPRSLRRLELLVRLADIGSIRCANPQLQISLAPPEIFSISQLQALKCPQLRHIRIMREGIRVITEEVGVQHCFPSVRVLSLYAQNYCPYNPSEREWKKLRGVFPNVAVLFHDSIVNAWAIGCLSHALLPAQNPYLIIDV